MKGKIKCFGLLSVLAITLGLSLSVSSNANALKYEITTIPFGQLYTSNYRQYGPSNIYQSFGFRIPTTALDENGNSWSMNYRNPAKFYNLSFNSITNTCSYYNGSDNSNNIRHYYGRTDYNYYYWYFPYYLPDLFDYSDKFSNADTIVPCMVLGSISNIQRDTFPSGVVNEYLKGFIPYRYNYNGIFAQDINTQDGLHRKSRFNFGMLFNGSDVGDVYGNLPDRWRSITIPLGLFTETDVPYGTNFNISGRFSFDSKNPQTDVFDISEDMNMNIEYNALTYFGTNSNVQTSSKIVSCTYELIDNRSNEDEYPWFLDFSCPITFEVDYSSSNLTSNQRIIGFTLHMGKYDVSPTDWYMWQYPMTDFALTDFYVVTNNDYTPAGKAFSDYTIDGSSPQDAPGSALDPSNPTDMDWVTSLSNLFSFQLFNPFSGFFLLFTDNSGCVNIPIIAGMLHSESTTYCPWFSADTRNIMTPVIGILATMFVFGFIVRWLKSTNSDFSPESSKGGD